MLLTIKEYFKKNENLIIFIAPLFLGFVFLLSKFTVFIINKGYFDYFDLDMSYYKSNFEIEISSLILNSIVIVFSFLLIVFFYNTLKTQQNLKEKVSDVSKLFSIVLATNFIVSFLFLSSFNFFYIIKVSIVCTTSELIVAMIQVSKNKKENTNTIVSVIKYQMSIKIFLLFFVISIITGSFYKLGVVKAQSINRFSVINNDQVVLYMNDEYMILSPFTIKNGIITIDIFEQRKVKTENLKIKKAEFKKVVLNSNN